MKKVLILTSDCGKTVSWKEREQYVAQFAKAAEASLSNTRIYYSTYSDMLFKVINQTSSIVDLKNKLLLTDYDFVHFKNWQYELEDASIIAKHLDVHGIPFANTEVNSGINFNKMSQMFSLVYENLPVPNSLSVSPDRYNEILEFLEQSNFEFPLIVKANDGSRGDSNYLVKTKQQLQKILSEEKDKHFIFQQFIPNDGDLRILFVGFNQKPLVFLRKGDSKSHLNNTSKGGAGTKINPQNLPFDIRQTAMRSARILKREIGGVDIIIDSKTKKHYVLEVNSTPALATGFALDEKLKAFCDYINDNIEVKEEE